MEKPDSKVTAAPLGSPFAFNLHNAIWLGGTTAIVLTLGVLRVMGVIH